MTLRRRSLACLTASVALVLSVAAGAALAPAANAVLPQVRCAAEHMEDGTMQPVLCKGRPNTAVLATLKANTPTIMELGPKASWGLITAAICEDLPDASFPMVVDGYTYQYAKYRWAGKRPTPNGLGTRLVAGTLCG